MNKTQLVEAVAQAADVTKVKASEAVEAVLASVSGALASGESVTLVGFGTFSVAQREARDGRNPLTGKTIKIPAKKAPKFSAGKALKEAVNK
ncbi:HU family DNA-binding protein [archaeon]|nr:HU family DNA-binding protein [archaeon]NCQ50457.1 HU family DNA-binding protein [archaeon]